MRLTDIYSSTAPRQAPEQQAVSQGASTDRDTSPKPMMESHGVAISWIGVLLALIALRVVYEVSE